MIVLYSISAISESFWQCAERSKRRTYMSDFTVVKKAKRDSAVKDAQNKKLGDHC